MRRAAKASVALTGMLLVALPSTGRAIPTYDSEVQLSPFIYYHLYLQSGTQYTIETKNLTSGGDTVLHVLYDNGSSIQQIAANDDSPTVASKVVFSAPATGFYKVWVRSFSNTTGGKADVVINGITHLTQAPFGGNSHYMAWSSGEQFRVATTRFTGSDDSMVFLLASNEGFLQMDDDSGPSLSAFAQAASSESGPTRVVYGVFPGATAASYGRLLVQYPPNPSSDTDGDGLTDELESLIGTSSTVADTDNDAIPDGIEAIGGSDTWAWTFSRSSTLFGLNPLVRNVYVEIDYMTDPTNPSHDRQPYANLSTDASEIFSSDGFSDLTLIIDESVPWHQNIAMDGCATGVLDCVDFGTQKASYFSTSFPERRPYFHYAAFAWQHDGGCSSGHAELLGNDLEITLGGVSCVWSFTWNEQLGTLIHELGHNLNLTHNSNDDPTRKYSVVHNSVMNYRYQIFGTSPIGRHTYSSGSSNPFCASCSTSPKQACITLKNANQCNTQAGAVCDCDVTEWWSATDYDMTEGGDYNDGIAYSSSGGTLPLVARPLNLDLPEQLGARFDKDPTPVVSASELATAVAAELKRFVPASSDPAVIAAREAQAKQEQADVTHDVQARAANALKPNLGRRRASVAKRMALLKAHGLVEGRDFVISSDRSALFMP
jgi:hypothetical protein